MADNFLEKRQEAYREQAARGVAKKSNSVLKLAERGVTTSFDSSYKVRTDQLEKIIEAALTVDSLSVHCFIVPQSVTRVCDSAANILLGLSVTADAGSFISIGRALQMMLFQAAEIGLSVSYTQNFDAAVPVDALSLSYEPVVLLTVGRAAR